MNEKREPRARFAFGVTRFRENAKAPECQSEPRRGTPKEKIISSCGAPSRPNGGTWRNAGFAFPFVSFLFLSPSKRVPMDAGRINGRGNALSDLYSSILYYTPRESGERSHKVLETSVGYCD